MKFLFLIFSLLIWAAVSDAAILTTDGSRDDVQAKINASVDGDIVDIPGGSFPWSSGITISGRGIHLRGEGAGQVVARSTDAVEIGTGTKVFTLNASGISSIAPGVTLTIERTGSQMNPVTGFPTGTRGFMTGTVTSYSGTTLTMNVATTGGSGTHGLWIVSTQAITTISHNFLGDLITVTPDTSHHVRISGIRTLWNTGAGEAYTVRLHSPVGGKVPLIHDCYMEHDGGGSHANIYATTGGGVVWNCSFPAAVYALSGVVFKIAYHAADLGVWTSAGTMGAADTNGTANFYFENCNFHAFTNCTDFDSQSKAVMRYCLFNNAGCGSHGPENTPYGVRHWEFYNNEFIFNVVGAGGTQTFPMNWFFYCRGGTGIFTDNSFDDIFSSWWGAKAEVIFALLNLREDWSPNPYWGANIPGVQYPSPRQTGRGYVDGTSLDGLGRNVDSATFVGDLEPVYMWNNTGTLGVGWSSGSGAPTNPDDASDYIVENRDYYTNTAKPGYAKYTYPHPLTGPTIRPTDGSPADVQAKINESVDGDILTIPPGTFTWSTAVSIGSRAIHLRGAGAGRVIARSLSVVTVGMGEKTFELNASGLPITVGQTLKIERTGGEWAAGAPTYYRDWMEGTVISYSGTTLVMNITSINAGLLATPQSTWIVSTIALTTIDNTYTGFACLGITEDETHSVEISGFRMVKSAGDSNHIAVYYTAGGKPVLFHDLYFEVYDWGDATFCIRSFTTRGVVWNTSFIAVPWANGAQGVTITNESGAIDSWAEPSYMGMADTTGTKNWYIEDCDYHGIENGNDMSANARVVIRHTLFNNAGSGSHGADTSYYGVRYIEFYDNEFTFSGYNNGQTIGLNHFIYYRGGTGVITNNIIPDIQSTDYGSKPEIRLQIQQLARNAGPNPLWSDNDGQVPEYPCPRQVGMGRLTGTGVDGEGRSTDPRPGVGWPGCYVGDSEPLYIWGNTGGGGGIAAIHGFEGGGGEGIDPDNASDYIMEGRDFITSGASKPGYVKYTYPHPLRTGGTIRPTDGTSADVQAKIDLSVDGDTVTVPAGIHPWTSQVNINGKGIHLKGAGSGRVVAWATDSVAFGTGTKVFTVQSGFSIAVGTTLRIWEHATSKDTVYMLGTVSSLSGTTLTMNITSNTGTGTHRPWLIATEPVTTILHSAGTGRLINIYEDTTHTAEISGMQFRYGTASGATAHFITWGVTSGGKMVQIHNCWFHMDQNSICLSTLDNRGLIYECTGTSDDWALSNRVFLLYPYGGDGSDTTSWSRPSDWGALDVGGAGKVYVEDCDFHGWAGLSDCSNSSRSVWRHNEFNHAALNSHGRDTGSIGIRLFEVYDNNFYFADLGADTQPCLYWVNMRGGTAVITDNVMPNISSSFWSNPAEIKLNVFSLGTEVPGFGWGAGDGGDPDYPAPRQVGFGYVTGISGGITPTENGHYFGDIEPIHIWNNTGSPAVSIHGGTGVDIDDPADYVQENREYYFTPKSGYTKYPYPHPLRTDSDGGEPEPEPPPTGSGSVVFGPGAGGVTFAPGTGGVIFQ